MAGTVNKNLQPGIGFGLFQFGQSSGYNKENIKRLETVKISISLSPSLVPCTNISLQRHRVDDSSVMKEGPYYLVTINVYSFLIV